MAEKPKTGARDPKSGKLLPGNQANLEHGGWHWLKHARVPSVKGKRRIQRELTALREKLMEAIPNSEDPRKQLLISQCVRTQGFVLLVEAFLRRFGILNPTALQKGRLEVQGSLTALNSFLNTQQRAVAALGMDKKELEAIKTPYEIAAEQEKPK